MEATDRENQQPANFLTDLDRGKQGEDAMERLHPEWVRKSGRANDFVIKENGEGVEVKTDYKTHKTGNFFFECISNDKKNTPGGPYQALEHGSKWYVIYVPGSMTEYTFLVSDLLEFLNTVGPELTWTSTTNDGYNTLGYLANVDKTLKAFADDGRVVGVVTYVRWCPVCKLVQHSERDFPPSSRRKGSRCRKCHREYNNNSRAKQLAKGKCGFSSGCGRDVYQGKGTCDYHLAYMAGHGAGVPQQHKIKLPQVVEFVQEIFDAQGGRCAITGVQLNPGNRDLDHIIPRSKGGDASRENLQWVHRAYNIMKKASDGKHAFEELRTFAMEMYELMEQNELSTMRERIKLRTRNAEVGLLYEASPPL